MFLSLRGLSGLLYAALIAELFVGGSSDAGLRSSLGLAVIVVVGLYIALSILVVRDAGSLGILGLVLLVGGFTIGGSLPADQQTMWPWYAGAAFAGAVVLALSEELMKGIDKTQELATAGIDRAKSFVGELAGTSA